MHWMYLFIAGLFEISWAVGLKFTHGFTHIIPSILTIIGIVIGLFGGYFLTMYILKTCELDITMFDPNVKILSYILGVIITIFFAFIVNIITYFSLKKINMIESLKSVE